MPGPGREKLIPFFGQIYFNENAALIYDASLIYLSAGNISRSDEVAIWVFISQKDYKFQRIYKFNESENVNQNCVGHSIRLTVFFRAN